MCKIIWINVLFFVAIANQSVLAGNYDKFYKNLPVTIQKPEVTSFPDFAVSITDFGAESTLEVLNSTAFRKAIDYVSGKGGGKVIVPRGVWFTGPVELKSNVNLHLEEGAVILFSSDFNLYPIIQRQADSSERYSPVSPLSAFNCVNIAVTGKGIIDGNGDSWRYRKKSKFTENEWNEIIKQGVLNSKGDMWYPTPEALEGHLYKGEITRDLAEKFKVFLRPKMVNFVNCKKILLQGVTFQNSPNWNVHPNCCVDIVVDNVYIRSPWNAQNSDALDLESCNRVLVVNSRFDVGDDAICIKSGKNEDGRKRGIPSQNILVDNCIVYHGHGGFVIGSEMSGGVNNVVARNCTFMGTDVGLRFKSTRGRGGIVENIYVDNIKMMNIDKNAIVFELFYGRVSETLPVPPVSIETPQFRNFRISNITCMNAETALTAVGLPEMPVENIVFENMQIKSTNGLIIKWAKNFIFRNVLLDIRDSNPLRILESGNINTDGILFAKMSKQNVLVNTVKNLSINQ